MDYIIKQIIFMLYQVCFMKNIFLSLYLETYNKITQWAEAQTLDAPAPTTTVTTEPTLMVPPTTAVKRLIKWVERHLEKGKKESL